MCIPRRKVDLMDFSCDFVKNHMCSVRDYGLNQYKNPCYNCCFGCKHAVEMDCNFVCTKVAEYYYPEVD
jgi:hypothetical protein